MLAPARIPVAEGKKMENMPKKLPSFPRQPGTKLVAKIDAVEHERVSLLQSSLILQKLLCAAENVPELSNISWVCDTEESPL